MRQPNEAPRSITAPELPAYAHSGVWWAPCPTCGRLHAHPTGLGLAAFDCTGVCSHRYRLYRAGSLINELRRRREGGAMRTWRQAMATTTSAADDPSAYRTELGHDLQIVLAEWISLVVCRSDRACRVDSYSLKHDLRADSDLYFTNGQFKGAMAAMDFAPVDATAANWTFRIRRRCRCWVRTPASCSSGFRLCLLHMPIEDVYRVRALARLAREDRERRARTGRRRILMPSCVAAKGVLDG